MKKKYDISLRRILLAILSAVLLHFLVQLDWIATKIYPTILYPFISGVLRIVFGWVPFSVGDVLYALFFIYLAFNTTRLVKALKGSSEKRWLFINSCRTVCWYFLVIYILFNLLWGAHYNRSAIQSNLNLQDKTYSALQLQKMNELLLEKVNDARMKSQLVNSEYFSNQFLFDQAIQSYNQAGKYLPVLHYSYASIKSSMWGWLGNYLGFTGYYNPFTGEAQVNTTIPIFLQPFVCCHEIAHQIGYAREDEANFVAYLVAKNSTDVSLKYSAYLDLFIYANRALKEYDSSAAKSIRLKLSVGVKNDIDEMKKFNQAHQNQLEPYVSKMYDLFLKTNEQPQGVITYSEVIGWLITYYNKNGEI